MFTMLSQWFMPSSSTKRNSACASTITFLNPVVPFESTIPTYLWYLLAIPNEDFHVPSQNLIQKFPFCNRTSSWCGEGKSVSFMPKIFDGSFNGSKIKQKGKKRKVALPPYLMM